MVIDVGESSGFDESKEEKPTKEIPAFMEELVDLVRKKFEAQNEQIERLRADIGTIKENEIETFSKKVVELENKIKSLENKLEKQKPNINDKILDGLKRV